MLRMDSMMAVVHNYGIASDAQNFFAVVKPVSLKKYRYSININYKISINIYINLHEKENSVTKI